MNPTVVTSSAFKKRRKAARPMSERYQFGLVKFFAVNRMSAANARARAGKKPPQHTRDK